MAEFKAYKRTILGMKRRYFTWIGASACMCGWWLGGVRVGRGGEGGDGFMRLGRLWMALAT